MLRLIRILSLALLSWGCSSLNDANFVDGGGGSGGSGGSGGGGGSNGLPCDVQALLSTHCQSCHGEQQQNGAPMPLVTRADLMARSIADPNQTFAQVAVLRMQSADAPMPPPPAATVSASEVAAMQTFISAGYPDSTCGGQMPDAAPPSCAGTYCEDFESLGGPITNGQMVGPWKASVAGTGTMMQIDGVNPHSGTKSLHITVPAGLGAHGTLHQAVATGGLVAGNNMLGRAMVFYSNTGGNELPLNVHSWIFNAAGMSTAAAGNVTMNMGGGGAKLQLNYHPPAPATEQSVQGGAITAGQWHCVQWQYDGSGTPPHDAAKVWVDGTLAVNVAATKGWSLATPWSSFDFGFTHYQTLANPVDVYLDDFVLGSSMIACP